MCFTEWETEALSVSDSMLTGPPFSHRRFRAAVKILAINTGPHTAFIASWNSALWIAWHQTQSSLFYLYFHRTGV